MARICEITRKKIPHFSNLADELKKDPKSYRRVLLKRKIKVLEVNGSISLKISEEGAKLLKETGGLAKFLKDRDDKKLSPRLLKLKRKIHGEPEPEKPKEEEAKAAPAPEKKAEAAPTEEKAPEEKKEEKAEAKAEEKPTEKPAEPVKEAAAPPPEKTEEKAANDVKATADPAAEKPEEKKE